MSMDLVALGRQNGAVIADYVVRRMQSGTLTPEEAAELLAAYIARRVGEITAKGIPRAKLAPWVEALEQAFDERLAQLAGPGK